MQRVADFVKTCIVEGSLLNRLPGYQLLKMVSRRLGSLEEGALFSAALASAVNCFMQWGIGSKQLLEQRD